METNYYKKNNSNEIIAVDKPGLLGHCGRTCSVRKENEECLGAYMHSKEDRYCVKLAIKNKHIVKVQYTKPEFIIDMSSIF